jgi:hypothetical protein
MFHHLTLAVRDRMIKELREYWAGHPRYDSLAQNIQGKYSFEERPQFGMIVKTGGASNVVLSPDNFIATLKGYVSLASVYGKKSVSLEWVREDDTVKPEAGVYHIKVEKFPNEDPYEFQLVIQRYSYETESTLIFTDDTTIELLNEPVAGSLRLREFPSGRSLGESEYVQEGTTITLLEAPPRGLTLSAQYTSKDQFLLGPYRVRPDQTYREIIPGVIFAVGRWIEEGDEQVILVSDTQEVVAHEYGGRWDISVDIDLVARDVHSQADLADRTVVWLWSSLRPKLSSMGLEMSDVSLGGEGEEVYDDNGDDYFYTASISLSIQADWFIHFPLIIPINHFNLEGFQILPPSDPMIGLGSSPDFIQKLL